MLRAAPVHPNAENATLDELKVAMEAAPNKRSYLRLGIERATVCQQFCRTERMVRLWIELFNSGGIDALITRPRPGRPRKVKLERVRDLLLPVLEKGAWKVIGDPTEGAFLAAGGKAGGDQKRIEKEWPKRGEIPFDSDRKRSSVIRQVAEGKLQSFTNGAPGPLLKRCTSVYTATGVRPLTEHDRAHILAQTSAMTKQSQRVLASAYRELDGSSTTGFRAFGARSETKPLWRITPFWNFNLVLVVVVSILLQVASHHTAFLGRVLKTSCLPLVDCVWFFALGSIPLLVLEVVKVVRIRIARK